MKDSQVCEIQATGIRREMTVNSFLSRNEKVTIHLMLKTLSLKRNDLFRSEKPFAFIVNLATMGRRKT